MRRNACIACWDAAPCVGRPALATALAEGTSTGWGSDGLASLHRIAVAVAPRCWRANMDVYAVHSMLMHELTAHSGVAMGRRLLWRRSRAGASTARISTIVPPLPRNAPPPDGLFGQHTPLHRILTAAINVARVSQWLDALPVAKTRHSSCTKLITPAASERAPLPAVAAMRQSTYVWARRPMPKVTGYPLARFRKKDIILISS